MRPLPLLLCAICAVPACGGDRGEAAAARTFAEFQAALQRRDEDACRRLLTHESAAALAEMPWQRIQEQQPLQVLGAAVEGSGYHVHIADPNTGGRRSQFVVVREYGHLVVDLIATAGLHAEPVEAAAGRDVFVPRELTPEDHDRIRLHDLAQPR